MRIRVVEILPSSEGLPLVSFDAPVGSASGHWAAKGMSPSIGGEYSAELELDLFLTAEALQAKPTSSTMSEASGVVQFRAVVEAVDSDGMLYVRLSEDCLLMIESDGSLTVGDGVKFSCKAAELKVYVQGG